MIEVTRKEQKKLRDNAERELRLEKVRELYQQSGLTYMEISRITGIKQNTLACYFTGRRVPSDKTVQLIQQKINCYFERGTEYVNKQAQRNRFIDGIYKILTELSPKEYGKAIIALYDGLPTESIKKPR